ncbi:MAG TPA: replication-relaxation family protein [Thermoleophilaceae bacterium]
MTAPTAHPPVRAVEVAILASLYQHRLLTTRQVHALHTPDASLRFAQRRLAALERRGHASYGNASHGRRLWYLTAAGARDIEATSEVDVRRRLLDPDGVAGPLQAHTLAVNEVGVAFVRAARARGDQFGPLGWRHEVAHPAGPARGRRGTELVIADAVLTYLVYEGGAARALEYRFVELDRATLPIDRLVAKLARYARMSTYVPKGAAEPGWKDHYPTFPALLLVLDGAPRNVLERRRDALAAVASDVAAIKAARRLSVSVCLLAELRERGPFAPIFRTLAEPGRAVDWRGEATSADVGGGR